MAPIRWWAQTLAVAVAFIWVVLLLVTAYYIKSKGPVGVAFDVAIGTKDPYMTRGANQEAVALAAYSWLLVPAAVGTIAAIIVQSLIQRARPYSQEDWGVELSEIRSEFEAFKKNHPG